MDCESENKPEDLEHLNAVCSAKRDLVWLIKGELLDGEREVKYEEASILLALYHRKVRAVELFNPNQEEFTTLKTIEMGQGTSQPQVYRRVTELLKKDRGYLESRHPISKGVSTEVKLTQKGEAFSKKYAADYEQLASVVLEGFSNSQRRMHYAVNQTIRLTISGAWRAGLRAPLGVDPEDSVRSILQTARDIRSAIQGSVVLPQDGLSVERADLLMLLKQKGTFTPFGEIQRGLVHSVAPTRHLVSKWVAEMGPGGDGFVETKPLPPRRMAAAITKKGAAKVEPILERYRRLAEKAMANVSQADREVHLLLNRKVSDVIRPRLEDLTTQEGSEPDSI